MSEGTARSERGGAEHPAPKPQRSRDPIDAALDQARYSSEGSSLPSESGLGPGAGEAPVASVSAGSAPEGDDDVPANPSMGGIPRHTEDRVAEQRSASSPERESRERG